jgi:excinuclease UvrABC helicase subunit UvrB
VERKDVIVVASVSCIYGLGEPQNFEKMMVSLRPGMEKDRDEVLRQLIDIQYERNEMDFKRGTFRVRGDVLEIIPANEADTAVRVEFFGDEIDRITQIDVLTGEIKGELEHVAIFPASHYVVPAEQIRRAADAIEKELEERVQYFKSEDKLLEAQRIAERTNFDVEMLKETGFCSGIENYSRHLAGLAPGPYEEEHELLRAEQVIRPTGLLDPEVSVRPVEGQIDDLIGEINKEVAKKNKILVTTLTKRMAEDLTDYMREVGIRVKYLHSDVDTLERTEIIRDMRLDVFDVLVGINLLREGLDIPEITLVAILDADKEGFLRSETSLIQTIGRAARNAEGHVIMYADTITESMQMAIDETKRRREIQMKYNEEHGITPQTIKKSVRDLISISKKVAAEEMRLEKDPESMSAKELEKLIADLTKQMKKAAAELNFEAAAELRDKLVELKKTLNDIE